MTNKQSQLPIQRSGKGSARPRCNLITNSHICGGIFQQARTITSYIPIPQISLIVAIACINQAKYGKQGIWKVNGHASSSHHSIWERSVSSKQCLIGIQSRMGVNTIGLRGLPQSLTSSGRPVRPSGSSGCRGSPSGSSGRPGRRTTSSRQDLIVITHKYRGQGARMHKTGSKEIKLTTNPILTRRS